MGARGGEDPGWVLAGDVLNPQPEFQAAIIAAVEKVTHIAPPDENGQIIEEDVTQKGVVNYAARELGLCMGMTGAEFVTTTEVYPDSPRVTDEVFARVRSPAPTRAIRKRGASRAKLSRCRCSGACRATP